LVFHFCSVQKSNVKITKFSATVIQKSVPIDATSLNIINPRQIIYRNRFYRLKTYICGSKNKNRLQKQ
jgi:hypothetical protein